ncbi:hypothetical protein LLH00_08025 [bacterium]|nr:hypothetical protein [bacterium]
MDPRIVFLRRLRLGPDPAMRGFTYGRVLGWEEYGRVRRGLVPLSSEDKWLVAVRGGELSFFRSGDGTLVYRAEFVNAEGAFRAETAQVNACAEQVAPLPDTCEAALLDCLIDRLLLGRPAPFPALPGVGGESAGLIERLWLGRAALRDSTVKQF